MFVFRVLVFVVVGLLLAAGGWAEVVIDKVLPFATADSLRVETRLHSDSEISSVEVMGKIIPVTGEGLLWEGRITQIQNLSQEVTSSTGEIHDLKPLLWSPNNPVLYDLIVSVKAEGKTLAETKKRFGFRSFENHNGQFWLNGKPIFLRGVAINPPSRDIPDNVAYSAEFAREYLSYLKSQNVNTIRLGKDSQVWFDLCDELGMMVFQGCYGSPPGAKKDSPPTDFNETLRRYREDYFENYTWHPSIVIYVLSNEVPYSGPLAEPYENFLRRAFEALRLWDPTRLYITNAGYGDGRSGDIFDFHRYWGWYYSSFLTFYNLRDFMTYNVLRKTKDEKPQPMTMTECVGCYTMPDGRFNVISRQLGCGLGWVGYCEDPSKEALKYQAFMIKQAGESYRRLRAFNPKLSGIMPFTILFFNWADVASFSEMKPKPALDQMKISYQPTLLSWELWTNQIYAGTSINPIAHVVNDSDDFSDLKDISLRWDLVAPDGKKCDGGEKRFSSVPYYGTCSVPLKVKIPADGSTGKYLLTGALLRDGKQISSNQEELFVASREWKKERADKVADVQLYDPSGATVKAMKRLDLDVKRIKNLRNLNPKEPLVIGEESYDANLNEASETLKQFVQDGGRVLCLRQDPKRFDPRWIPIEIDWPTADPLDWHYPQRATPFFLGSFLNPLEPTHPVFKGLHRDQFALWSDYTNWDQTKAGFPKMFPVSSGIELPAQEALEHVAVLVNYGRSLEGVALCEIFDGKGSVVLSGFDHVARIGLDPVADRFMKNLVRYVGQRDGHEIHPLVDSPIVWGNYSSERGIISGTHNGFEEDVAQIDLKTGSILETGMNRESGWNSHPGRQFTVRGRHLALSAKSEATDIFDEEADGATKATKERSNKKWAKFCLRLPEGKTKMITRVENPADAVSTLKIAVSGKTITTTKIPAKQTLNVTSDLPSGITDVGVQYTGAGDLIFLETRFE